jgi:alpha-beta hydrolase superfamily lysophospholipase
MTEQAVLLASTQSMVGVVTDAEIADDRPRPAIVFLNAGLVHRVGPNRLHVRLARDAARRGFVCLRFDLSGVGDSAPRLDGSSVRTAALTDVRDALDFVAAEHRAASFILVGLCSGADLAFRAALADMRVTGVILIDGLPYTTKRSRVHHYVNRLMRRGWWHLCTRDNPLWRRLRRWRRPPARQGSATRRRDVPPRPEAEAGLRELTRRGVRMLLLFTSGREYSYGGQFRDMFPSVRSDRIDVAFFRNADHTFTLRANQELLFRTVDEWIARFQ